MKDIFDAKIVCNECNVQMKPVVFERNGFRLRAVECSRCKNRIIHPSDLNNYEHYNALKHKTFNVKLRVVGNSHAVSIPKEIVDFINEMNHEMKRNMNEMVKLCFEDFGKLSLRFVDEKNYEKEEDIKKKWQ